MVGSRGDVEEPNGSSEPQGAGVAVLAPEAAPPALPAPRRRSRLPIIGAIAAAVVIVAAVAGVLANNALAQQYSPTRAVNDYFKAQQSGNVNGMWANATYVRGEGSYNDFFSQSALQAMMQLPENRDIRNVKLTSLTSVDSSRATATVDLRWHGVDRSLEFTVRKDPANVHWLFYPSWRIEIPAASLRLTLPNQAGAISIDGIENPQGAGTTTLAAIMGFHVVTMGPTDFYDSTAQTVDAVSDAAVTMKGNLSQTAIQAANSSVKDTLTTSCDVKKYEDCPGHTYSAPDQNYIYYMPVPGHGNVDYSKYLFTLTGDPTAGMTITVSADSGKVSVSGTCTTTLTVDGRNHYNLKGTFSGTLTWSGGGFDSDLNVYCDQSAG